MTIGLSDVRKPVRSGLVVVEPVGRTGEERMTANSDPMSGARVIPHPDVTDEHLRDGSDDVDVRQAVVTATGYLGWPSLLEPVAEPRDRDPDAEVREHAALVLDAIAKSRATSHDEGEAKS